MAWSEVSQRNRDLAAKVLTDKQHEVLRLYFDGHPFRKIARHMGITEGTVRGHYERALEKLGEAMRKEKAA